MSCEKYVTVFILILTRGFIQPVTVDQQFHFRVSTIVSPSQTIQHEAS
jgi:hypothetical protein